jgi:hypothetical protein
VPLRVAGLFVFARLEDACLTVADCKAPPWENSMIHVRWREGGCDTESSAKQDIWTPLGLVRGICMYVHVVILFRFEIVYYYYIIIIIIIVSLSLFTSLSLSSLLSLSHLHLSSSLFLFHRQLPSSQTSSSWNNLVGRQAMGLSKSRRLAFLVSPRGTTGVRNSLHSPTSPHPFFSSPLHFLCQMHGSNLPDAATK